MTVLACDLGQFCAASIMRDGASRPYVVDVSATLWERGPDPWNEITAARHLRAVINGFGEDGDLAEMDGFDAVLVEATWWAPVRGRIDPRSITPLSAMVGVLEERYPCQVVLLDPHDIGGVVKADRAFMVPRLVEGFDPDAWRGPRGGEHLLPHVADSVYLGYWWLTRSAWDAGAKEALREPA